MGSEEVLIYDTSLRDGLRNSGVRMTLDERISVARLLEELNVAAIEVGFGGPSEIETMQRLARAVDTPVVYGLTRAVRTDVDRVLAGVEPARRPGVNVFHPVSEAFLADAELSRDQATDRSVEAIAHARGHVDHVVFALQDASRADPDFLVEISGAAIAAGATTVSVSDTVSHALPEEFGGLCAALRERTAGGDQVVWSVHCHDGLGMAVANSVAAVARGATQVECTVNGIGEGDGNTSLQAVVAALRARTDVFGEATRSLRGTHLDAAGRLVAAIAG